MLVFARQWQQRQVDNVMIVLQEYHQGELADEVDDGCRGRIIY